MSFLPSHSPGTALLLCGPPGPHPWPFAPTKGLTCLQRHSPKYYGTGEWASALCPTMSLPASIFLLQPMHKILALGLPSAALPIPGLPVVYPCLDPLQDTPSPGPLWPCIPVLVYVLHLHSAMVLMRQCVSPAPVSAHPLPALPFFMAVPPPDPAFPTATL